MYRWFGGLMVSLLIIFNLGQNSHASVVMQGTRVIVNSGMKEKSVQFSNPSKHTYLIQVWGSHEPGIKEEVNVLPFTLTPPIFKITPQTGQTVRLRVLPDSTLTDTEKVYYLNFSQIPAIEPQSTEEGNHLILLMTSSVKIFYRPMALKEGPGDIASQLHYRLDTKNLVIENPTPFHVSINAIQVESHGEKYPVIMRPLMISPKSTKSWPLPAAMSPLNSSELDASLIHIWTINDYGADVPAIVPLTKK